MVGLESFVVILQFWPCSWFFLAYEFRTLFDKKGIPLLILYFENINFCFCFKFDLYWASCLSNVFGSLVYFVCVQNIRLFTSSVGTVVCVRIVFPCNLYSLVGKVIVRVLAVPSDFYSPIL